MSVDGVSPDGIALPGSLPRGRAPFRRTRDHWWWREGWGPGTRYLTWHLTFEDAGSLHEAAQRAADALSTVPFVDVVPREWQHLTMAGVGFADEFDSSTVQALAHSVFDAASAIVAEPVVLDRLFLFEEGVCLSADSPWLHELRGTQVECGRSVGGADPAPDERFHPHVTLAYFSGAVDEDSVDEALRRAALHPVVVSRPRLSLIELGRDDRLYTWRVIAQQILGG